MYRLFFENITDGYVARNSAITVKQHSSFLWPIHFSGEFE